MSEKGWKIYAYTRHQGWFWISSTLPAGYLQRPDCSIVVWIYCFHRHPYSSIGTRAVVPALNQKALTLYFVHLPLSFLSYLRPKFNYSRKLALRQRKERISNFLRFKHFTMSINLYINLKYLYSLKRASKIVIDECLQMNKEANFLQCFRRKRAARLQGASFIIRFHKFPVIFYFVTVHSNAQSRLAW